MSGFVGINRRSTFPNELPATLNAHRQITKYLFHPSILRLTCPGHQRIRHEATHESKPDNSPRRAQRKLENWKTVFDTVVAPHRRWKRAAFSPSGAAIC